MLNRGSGLRRFNATFPPNIKGKTLLCKLALLNPIRIFAAGERRLVPAGRRRLDQRHHPGRLPRHQRSLRFSLLLIVIDVQVWLRSLHLCLVYPHTKHTYFKSYIRKGIFVALKRNSLSLFHKPLQVWNNLDQSDCFF